MDEERAKEPIRLLTQSEVAVKIGKSESVVRSLRVKSLISYLPGKPILFEECDVDAYIAAREAAIHAKKAPYTPGTPEFQQRIAKEQYVRIHMDFFKRRQREEERLKKK